ncbi:MAG: 5-(carboxyamino)imidazole ribonucleotide synthase [Myxococcales bacterium]|nr:MAG: 5-(carboxyamino)imidazole ribonucleotide synthase [Myxococcales bacterium]
MPDFNKVGILGDGQLARMLAMDGHRIGIQCVVLGHDERSSGAQVTEFRKVDYADPQSILQASHDLDLLSYEMEHLPYASLLEVSKHKTLHPAPEALRLAQDRLLEKQFVQSLGIPVVPFMELPSTVSLVEVAEELHFPFLIKTRTAGYDGKGQLWVRSEADFEQAQALLISRPCIAEAKCEFDREVSLVMVRGVNDQLAWYPLVENVHREGILFRSEAPAPKVSEALFASASSYATKIAKHLDYRGVLTIEFFEKNGELCVNEIAPRVHNSGHWTLEGAGCSQFENHLRAICGRSLGSCEAVGKSVMFNFLGQMPPLNELFSLPFVRLHRYGKEQAPKRKLGHLTAHHCNVDLLSPVLAKLEKIFS